MGIVLIGLSLSYTPAFSKGHELHGVGVETQRKIMAITKRQRKNLGETNTVAFENIFNLSEPQFTHL